jgi:hypothetical protein
MSADLIAQLAAATAGSRELDWAIREEVGGVEIPLNPDPRCWSSRAPDGTIYQAQERGGSTSDFYLPFYTESVDAALALRPEGANCWGIDAGPGRIDAYWSRNNVKDGHWMVEASHPKSEAIALCIAALKAWAR